MNKLSKNLSVVAIAIAASFQAQADIRINGFANLTAGKTLEDTNYFGQTEDIDFSAASLFALQVSGDVSDNVTATAQIVARGSDDYSADFEWAYLSYEMNPNSTITAGRFRLPLFRYSASLDVGYSYHWIAAPVTVYDVVFNNLNGLRYDYTNYSGDFEYLFQLSYGNYSDEIVGGINEGSNVVLTSAEGSYNGFKGRLVWGRGDILYTTPELDDNISGFLAAIGGATGGVIPGSIIALVDDLIVDNDEGVFLGVGLEYDSFDWFVAGEWTRVELEDSLVPNDTAYYVTAGVRLGKWTPHVTYQARDGRGDIRFLDRIATIPAPFQPGAGALNAGLQANTWEDYSIATVGVRYDVMANVALKAEVSRYDNKIEPVINPRNTIDTTILNVSLNYVF